MRITIDEYAKRYKMSKEMIHAKLRAGRLDHEEVDGTVYIRIKETPATPPSKPAARTTAGAIILMYQKENAALKERIRKLEEKVDGLIADKEKMLREERDRIEAIYTARDEQLKSFLELINTKMLKESASARIGSHREAHTAETQAAATLPDENPRQDTVPKEPVAAKRIELRKYLSLVGYTPAESKQVKKRFAKAYGNDIRVLQENGEFILDFSKYDYSDLLTR